MVDGLQYLVVVVVANAHMSRVVYATGHPVVGYDNARLLLVEEQYFGPISCLACLGTSLLIGPFALFVCLCPCDRQLSAVDAQMPRQMVVVDRPRPQTMMMQPREPEAVARPEGTNEHCYPKV